MRVKTFRGSSATAVMAQIKRELGPEAVILSNQTKRVDGKSICEIMAAVEPNQDPQIDSEATGAGQPRVPAPGWEREWCEMKGHLSALLKPHITLDSLPPRQKMAMEYLEREGVDEAIRVGLFRRLKVDRTVSLLAELGKVAKVKPFSQFTEKFQIVTGPSGVGKTTTLVRMALAAKKQNPEKRIGIINCDDRGVGGKAILKRYAELASLTYADTPDPEDFIKVLIACRNFDVIFVDLPALPRHQNLAQWLGERSLALRDDVAVHLTLSPCFALEHCRFLWENHRSELVKSIIWTKLDEACSFGSVINVAQMTGLPVSTLSYGPGVANTMAEADSQALWKLVFSHQMPGGVQASNRNVEQAA